MLLMFKILCYQKVWLFPFEIMKKSFFNYKTIGFIVIWLNITLLDKEDWGGFYQKQKFQCSNFVSITQLLNDVKYIFTETLKNSDYCILSTKPPLGSGLIVFWPFLEWAYWKGGGGGVVWRGALRVSLCTVLITCSISVYCHGVVI